MPILNSVLNRYEQWNDSPASCEKKLILSTAPAPILLAVSGTIVWECVKLPFACASIPFYFASRLVRFITQSQANTRLEQLFHSPTKLLSCVGKIVQLIEGLLYSLVAFFNLRATLNFFKGAGLFNSRKDCKRLHQQMKIQQEALERERSLNNTIIDLNTQLANRPSSEAFSSLEHRIGALNTALQVHQASPRTCDRIQIEELNHTIQSLKSELEQTKTRADQVPILEGKILELRQELQDEKDWETQLNTLKQQIEQLGEKIKQEDLNSSIHQLARIDSSRRLLNKKLEDLTKELMAVQSEYDRAHGLIQELVDERDWYIKQNEELSRQLNLTPVKKSPQLSRLKGRVSRHFSNLFTKPEN